VTEEQRDEQRRRRAEVLVAGPAGRERGPGEGQNRRMTAQGSSPSEESRRRSPERVNRRRGRSSAAAAMVERVRVWGGERGRSGVDKGRGEGKKEGTARDATMNGTWRGSRGWTPVTTRAARGEAKQKGEREGD